MASIQVKPCELFIGGSANVDKNILSQVLDKTLCGFNVASDYRYKYLDNTHVDWIGLYESGQLELHCNKLRFIKLLTNQ